MFNIALVNTQTGPTYKAIKRKTQRFHFNSTSSYEKISLAPTDLTNMDEIEEEGLFARYPLFFIIKKVGKAGQLCCQYKPINGLIINDNAVKIQNKTICYLNQAFLFVNDKTKEGCRVTYQDASDNTEGGSSEGGSTDDIFAAITVRIDPIPDFSIPAFLADKNDKIKKAYSAEKVSGEQVKSGSSGGTPQYPQPIFPAKKTSLTWPLVEFYQRINKHISEKQDNDFKATIAYDPVDVQISFHPLYLRKKHPLYFAILRLQRKIHAEANKRKVSLPNNWLEISAKKQNKVDGQDEFLWAVRQIKLEVKVLLDQLAQVNLFKPNPRLQVRRIQSSIS